MKKIFLDLGANRLQGLTQFKQNIGIDDSWVVLCYEPNKEVYEAAVRYVNCKTNPLSDFLSYPNFKIENKAVSNKTGIEEIKNVVEYTVENKTWLGDAGSSTLLNNINWHHQNTKYKTENISTVDINEVLTNLIEQWGVNTEIYIKMDIEGYEYKVVRRMLSSQHLNNIKQIYIEWHPHFFEDIIEKKAEAFDLIRSFFGKGLQSFMHH